MWAVVALVSHDVTVKMLVRMLSEVLEELGLEEFTVISVLMVKVLTYIK